VTSVAWLTTNCSLGEQCRFENTACVFIAVITLQPPKGLWSTEQDFSYIIVNSENVSDLKSVIFLKLGQWKRDQNLLCYLKSSKLWNGVKSLLLEGHHFSFEKNILVQKKKEIYLEQYGGVNDRANYNLNLGWIMARKWEHEILFLLLLRCKDPGDVHCHFGVPHDGPMTQSCQEASCILSSKWIYSVFGFLLLASRLKDRCSALKFFLLVFYPRICNFFNLNLNLTKFQGWNDDWDFLESL